MYGGEISSVWDAAIVCAEFAYTYLGIPTQLVFHVNVVAKTTQLETIMCLGHDINLRCAEHPSAQPSRERLLE